VTCYRASLLVHQLREGSLAALYQETFQEKMARLLTTYQEAQRQHPLPSAQEVRARRPRGCHPSLKQRDELKRRA
jgi:hypothetical protein